MTFETLASSPTAEFFLPFFFVFAAVFAILSSVGKSSKIEAFNNQPVNVMLSLVFGFLAATNKEFVSFFIGNSSTVIKIFIGLFVLAFVLEVFGLRGGKIKPKKELMIIVGGVILLLIFFLSDFSYLINIPGINTIDLFVGITLILIITMFIYAFFLGEENKKG